MQASSSFIIRLDHKDIKALDFLKQHTRINTEQEIILHALRCLVEKIYAAQDFESQVLLQKDGLAYELRVGKKISGEIPSPNEANNDPKAKMLSVSYLGDEDKEYMKNLLSWGAGSTEMEVARFALIVYLEIILGLVEGWELVWKTQDGKVSKQNVEEIRLDSKVVPKGMRFPGNLRSAIRGGEDR